MDYILFGIGSGASLALIGWLLRELGPRLRDGRIGHGEILSAREMIDRMSWSRFCSSCGMALALGGTAILLMTVVVAFWNPGDTIAARIMLGTYAAVSLLMIVWAILYTREFGTSGIYRPVERKTTPPTPETTSDKVGTEEASPTPVEETASSEPAPDFEAVAASRGGLGRFAAFFQRDRDEAPADDAPESRMVVEEDVEVTSTEDGEVVEETEMVVIAEAETTETDGDTSADPEPEAPDEEDTGLDEETRVDAEPSDASDVEPLAAASDDAPEFGIDPEPTDDSPTSVEESGTDSDSTGEVETTQTARRTETGDHGDSDGEPADGQQRASSPEEDALAALRRRRLARLADTDEA